jgi:hypothetical protein
MSTQSKLNPIVLAVSLATVCLPASEEKIASQIAVSRDDRAAVANGHKVQAVSVCRIVIAQFMTTFHPCSGGNTRDDSSKFR